MCGHSFIHTYLDVISRFCLWLSAHHFFFHSFPQPAWFHALAKKFWKRRYVINIFVLSIGWIEVRKDTVGSIEVAKQLSKHSHQSCQYLAIKTRLIKDIKSCTFSVLKSNLFICLGSYRRSLCAHSRSDWVNIAFADSRNHILQKSWNGKREGSLQRLRSELGERIRSIFCKA